MTETTFVMGQKTATTDVVVESGGETTDGSVDPGQRISPRGPGLKVGLEHWQFSDFTEAHAVVATIDVAIRSLDEESLRCSVSAKASRFESSQGTLTH